MHHSSGLSTINVGWPFDTFEYWLIVFGLVVLFFGAVLWALRVQLKRTKAIRTFLMKEGFTKVSQPQAIDEEPWLTSPGFRNHRVFEAWERDFPMGQVRVLFLYLTSSHSGGGR